MEEPRWYNSAEEYRTIQSLSREGRYHEALDRASRALAAGQLGRKHAARLNSLVCWLYTEPLNRTCPTAILHGEEAVRLAELVKDPWIKCEALCRLVVAYCQSGAVARAKTACEEIAAEVHIQPGVMQGGKPALLLLEALVAETEGNLDRALRLLDEIDRADSELAPVVVARMRAHQLRLLSCLGRIAEARELAAASIPLVESSAAAMLEWALGQAWLALETASPEAVRLAVDHAAEQARTAGHGGVLVQCHAILALLAERAGDPSAAGVARTAFQRAMAMGRVDLVRMLRERLGQLL